MSGRKDLWAGAAARQSAGLTLFVTPRHIEWLRLPEAEQVFSPEARQFALDVWDGKYEHERTGRFSASSIGKCSRRVLFGFAGVPELQLDLPMQDMAAMGNALHLRWQMEGITQGWLPSPEVWTYDPISKLGGSMDGVLADGSLFEYKGAESNKFSRVLDDNGPTFEHMVQVHAYFRIANIDEGSVVYQDRGRGRYHEFRLKGEPKYEDALDERMETVETALATNELPPMLADCKLRSGWTYRSCPYRLHCPTVNTVDGSDKEE